MKQSETLAKLYTRLKELAVIRSTGGLLSWDEQTHLPPAGTAWRAEQLAYISKTAHQMFTSDEVGDWISTLEQSSDAADVHSDLGANLRTLRHEYDKSKKLPPALVEELARTEVLAQNGWVEARKKSSWTDFQPWLTKTIDLKKQVANCYGFKDHLYDALLDDYEPHEKTSTIKKVFEEIRQPIVDLVKKVQSSKKRPKKLAGPFPIDQQEAFGKIAAQALGFDFNAGRLDVSVHPFCSGMAPGDTRMTTRYRENELTDALFGVLHETGHALYEQGLPKDKYIGQPLSDAISLGIHESQSRMWENLVGRSRSFWKHFSPIARKHFNLESMTDDDLMFTMNEIEPSYIRVEADEVTYNLHILLRFEMETSLITGEIDVKNVPQAWNEKMTKYLGLKVDKDSNGCLQDVHWSAGLFGYFPTYTLGNLYSAQFYEAARKELGDLDAMFARGEFKPLLDWLRKNIHQHGRRYTAGELVQRITGRPLQAAPLLQYLTGKVDEFYGD